MFKLKNYVYFNNLGNEEVLFEDIIDYDVSLTLDDIFHEVADALTPIYYNDIWNNAPKISEFIDQGLSEGLASGDDIINTLQVGYYLYYMDILQTNKENIIYNIFAKDVNRLISKMDGDEIRELDLDYIKDTLELVSETHVDCSLISIKEQGYEVILESKESKRGEFN